MCNNVRKYTMCSTTVWWMFLVNFTLCYRSRLSQNSRYNTWELNASVLIILNLILRLVNQGLIWFLRIISSEEYFLHVVCTKVVGLYTGCINVRRKCWLEIAFPRCIIAQRQSCHLDLVFFNYYLSKSLDLTVIFHYRFIRIFNLIFFSSLKRSLRFR